jgi:hypothetical protein
MHGDTQLANAIDRLRGKGFVDLEDIDLREQGTRRGLSGEVTRSITLPLGVQGYRGTGVQGYRGTGVQGYRGTLPPTPYPLPPTPYPLPPTPYR